MSRAWWPTACLFVVCGLGCGSGQPSPQASPPPAPAFRDRGVAFEAGPRAPAREQAPADGAAAKPPAVQPAAPAGAELPAERKIIFTGVLDVEVKEFTAGREQLDAIVKRFKAYYSKSEITGDAGKKRYATFTVKVPVEHFQLLVDAVAAMGNPVKNATDSEDVTEEFVDIAARVKNLKAEEEVLNKLLKDAAGRLDDVFKIREQIRQVRGDIERAEGRMTALGKLAALSTVTVTIREIEKYTAPTAPKPSDAPPFGERVTTTFDSSWKSFVGAAEEVALFAVAASPWLLPALPVLAGLWLWWRAGHGPRWRAAAAPPA